MVSGSPVTSLTTDPAASTATEARSNAWVSDLSGGQANSLG